MFCFGKHHPIIQSGFWLLFQPGKKRKPEVYIALCYYKLDYYDVALEILQTYLSQYPQSITAVNLKARLVDESFFFW